MDKKYTLEYCLKNPVVVYIETEEELQLLDFTATTLFAKKPNGERHFFCTPFSFEKPYCYSFNTMMGNKEYYTSHNYEIISVYQYRRDNLPETMPEFWFVKDDKSDNMHIIVDYLEKITCIEKGCGRNILQNYREYIWGTKDNPQIFCYGYNPKHTDARLAQNWASLDRTRKGFIIKAHYGDMGCLGLSIAEAIQYIEKQKQLT